MIQLTELSWGKGYGILPQRGRGDQCWKPNMVA